MSPLSPLLCQHPVWQEMRIKIINELSVDGLVYYWDGLLLETGFPATFAEVIFKDKLMWRWLPRGVLEKQLLLDHFAIIINYYKTKCSLWLLFSSGLQRCLQTTLWRVHSGILMLCSNHNSILQEMHMTHFSWLVSLHPVLYILLKKSCSVIFLHSGFSSKWIKRHQNEGRLHSPCWFESLGMIDTWWKYIFLQLKCSVTCCKATTVPLETTVWDHLPLFCLGRTAVLICNFISAKPRLTALKTLVSPRFFSVDLSRGERQDAVGFE